MPNVSSPAALPQYIEQLLNQHKAHTQALKEIESTLSRVTAALGGASTASAGSAPAPAKRGRPFKNSQASATVAPAAAGSAAASKASSGGRRGRRPANGGMTANDFVLAFVQSKKNPSTQEINKHWKDAGRSGVADNSLSILTRAKKLKRLPLGNGMRGSRYMVA